MYIREQAVGASLDKEKFSALEWPVRNRTGCNRYLLKVGLCKLGGTAMTSSHEREGSFFIIIICSGEKFYKEWKLCWILNL